jgi:hypothetical protein
MPYKVFISANDDALSQQYIDIVRSALFRMSEFPILPVALTDAGSVVQDRWEVARRLIQDANIFVGIYTGLIGPVPAGHNESYLEMEYRLSQELGLPCYIFMPQTPAQTDERFTMFKQGLEREHILTFFKDEAELAAKIVLAMGSFRQVQRQPTVLIPPSTPFQPSPPASGAGPVPTPRPARPITPISPVIDSIGAAANREIATTPAPPAAAPLPDLIEQVLALATDDIELIVRRALELHDAQKAVQEQNVPDGWMRVNPIFGTPMAQSQFQSDIFMIMPFRPQYDAIYQNIVRPICSSLNLTIKRGDDFASVTGSIINEIWAALNACRLVVVETTEVNANVYYELGIAHTLGKPAVLLTQEREPQKLPFDLRHMRFVVYDDTIPGGEQLEKDLKKAIVWLLNDLEENGAEGAPDSANSR